MNIFISVRKTERALKVFFSGFLVFSLIMSQVALPFGVAYAQTEQSTETEVVTDSLIPDQGKTSDEQPNINVQSKINICHKTGDTWQFMDTPAGPSLDGHLGHGDFLYNEAWGEGSDQKCIEHNPNPPVDVCPNLEGTQTDPEDCPTLPQEAQISITKIICPTEDLLPNWGSGAPNIDAGTAQAFLATHPTCYESFWTFEWAPNGTANPGDNVGVAGGAWQPFDQNNLPEIPAGQRAWVREQVQDGYLPFSGATSDLDSESAKNSAEFYCNNDVLNYDNYDYIDPVVGGELYHCVAFNVPTRAPLQCNPEVNLIENGDFEAPALSNGSWAIIPDTNTLLKWLVAWAIPTPISGILGLEIQNNVAGAPAGGSQHAELDGDHPVTIWQDIPTIPGKEYSLTFKYSPRPGRNLADNSLQVKKDGVVLGADVASDGSANSNTLWQSVTRTFIATGSTTKVELFDNGSDTSFGGYVDDVDLRCVGNPVQKQDGFIHVYKFIDGEQATPESANGVSFPMFNNRDVNTFTLNPNGWWGGSYPHPADIPYEATAWQAGGGVYSAWENLTTPLVGASCDQENNPDYALEGYSSGATLQEAIANGANKSLETPSFVIDGDVNLIVWNKKCVDEQVTTGSIEIKKYLCPANFVPNRNDNGVGDAIPEGCSAQSGASFGYVHGDQTDANGPYPELSETLTPGGTTNENGILTIGPISSAGRYLIKETDGTNLLGLYCEGDGDTNPNNNDNQELTFVPAGGVAKCVAYNKAPTVEIVDMCPNIPEVQTEVPQGMHKDEAGNCVPNVSEDTYQCSDGIDNSDQEDTLVDSADPACHSDGNVNNPSSYVPTYNSESNESAICSDGKDNDSDQLIDSNDPGCLSGEGGSWNPSDDDESNQQNNTSGGGGGGGGGGAPGVPFVPQALGKVLGESTSCGLYLNEYLKKGKKNNVEEVKKLQQFLNDYLKLNPKLPINGNFGLQTYKAVVKFQEQENNLVLNPWVGVTLKDAKKGTGWVFKTTVWRINNIMCPELNLPIPAITLD